MSDAIKHECGIALVRLLKPLDFYIKKYGSATYGIDKMYLLMEKQHNRGQDGAGIANIKFDVEPGQRYISRYRSNDSQPIIDIFTKINSKFEAVHHHDPKLLKDADWLKKNVAFTGELFLGHLRYGTFGGNSIEQCHPFLRQNNWMTRNLVIAGNFNLTNVDELFQILVEIGQHPKQISDTVTIMEKIGHYLDEGNQLLYDKFKAEGYPRIEISKLIARDLDLQKILSNSAADWDGGYVMAGLIGHGDAFVLRDPSGIRPAFYYQDDEVVVVTSERPVIQTAFNVAIETIHEIKPGHALIIKKNGKVSEEKVKEPLEKRACSFERIYFSRGSDKDIYSERKQLGRNICPQILKAIDGDLENSVFSFIPNTAEISFYGMMKGLQDKLNEIKLTKIKALGSNPSDKDLQEILNLRNRIEKIAVKDAKLRTFITQDNNRDNLVAHVYDITYGTVFSTDNLVIIDDSIVRGTTLKQSILRILDRLNPKKIVVVSSAPQIRYPDCYGIDMAKLGDFIAFQAAISLLKDNGKQAIINETYQQCKMQEKFPKDKIVNHVKAIYDCFTAEEISKKISELLTPENINAKIEIVYQSIEGLHNACPNHKGDWYFTGNYPTPGGNKVVNNAFIYYYEGKNKRAY
ncbi:MAG: amidophosphoribosyltransferase [Flavobacteriales bacterium CG_4_10_14_0_2_um_filter_32_8]|nr:MAG: amidophosphoribosyltransferase [Bacteroidetes bacterium CG2_30_32_10]PJA09748.1 MAG: amidophosphoribosyltransferase [Flavobacteriales bacterium CG_4_10_14_0_2_um_filter_32_8]PJB14422.1 MAG: amidophosphoribosyltransferase [Flavobacteriales bacterium CG_4_9_14_3_um_filter_32_8]